MKVRINEPRSVRAGGVSIETTGDVIEVDLGAELAAAPAAAIRDAIAAGIRGIRQAAAPATLLYRDKARKAFERGAAWATGRFARAPSSGGTLFNASGELAENIAVAPGGDRGSYQVTAPADRLGDLPGAAPGSTLERLRSLVPALSAPLDVPAVRAAIEATWAKLVRLAR